MSADFWAGYISGAAGILIGNPLDLIKTRLQAGPPVPAFTPSGDVAVNNVVPSGVRGHFDRAGTLLRGATTPLLTYGALNALLFVSYNRTLLYLSPPTSSTTSPTAPQQPLAPLSAVFLAGATAGLATFVVSAPTELIKCRAQVSTTRDATSWAIARQIWRSHGVRGLYFGGGVTSVRDSVGYGFYFYTYELATRALAAPQDGETTAALKVLFCGGLAGIATWASIFPLDVVKTRVQTQNMSSLPTSLHGTATAVETAQHGERRALLSSGRVAERRALGALEVAREAWRTEGLRVFCRGLGVCCARAFVVNAVQWAVYEWVMRILQQPQ